MNVLFLGCHCDDIELGCGGTISRFNKKWRIHCHVLSQTGLGGFKMKGICRRAMKDIGVSSVSFSNFTPSCFQESRQEIWRTMNDLGDHFSPDIVFSNESDEHQDHKVAWEEVSRNFRKSSIIQYRIVRSSISFAPNAFVPLEKNNVRAKCRALRRYEAVYDKNYLKRQNIVSQLRSEGIYIEAKYCESFCAKKIIANKHCGFDL